MVAIGQEDDPFRQHSVLECLGFMAIPFPSIMIESIMTCRRTGDSHLREVRFHASAINMSTFDNSVINTIIQRFEKYTRIPHFSPATLSP